MIEGRRATSLGRVDEHERVSSGAAVHEPETVTLADPVRPHVEVVHERCQVRLQEPLRALVTGQEVLGSGAGEENDGEGSQPGKHHGVDRGTEP